jgi:hypothetical protein
MHRTYLEWPLTTHPQIHYIIPTNTEKKAVQSFRDFFNSGNTEEGAKIVKAHHQFFKREILSLRKQVIDCARKFNS